MDYDHEIEKQAHSENFIEHEDEECPDCGNLLDEYGKCDRCGYPHE